MSQHKGLIAQYAASPKYPSIPQKSPAAFDSWNPEDSTPVVSPGEPNNLVEDPPTEQQDSEHNNIDTPVTSSDEDEEE